MTQPAQFYTDKPIFQGQRNGVINCAAEGCDWSFCGPRSIMQRAWNDHYRQSHSEEVGVALTDSQLRQTIWIP